jgi:catechol-2,3-dioxygenase
MRFKQVILHSGDLDVQRHFYGQVCELPIIVDASSEFTVQTGTTHLTFVHVPNKPKGIYHLAFNVPENQLLAASVWLAERTSLVKEGHMFEFVDWNAHAIYFRDGEGNIMEFIARHNLPNSADNPLDFDQTKILEVSEVGLVTPDVLGTVQELNSTLNLPTWRGVGSDNFTAVGDEQGLLIVVNEGRPWMTTEDPAMLLPVEIVTEDVAGDYQLANIPYRIRGIS